MNTKTRLSILHQLMKALYRKQSWCGETHVQKAAFFLQHLSGEKPFPFVLYKFGPFSFELRDDLELMRTYGVLTRQVASQGYGPRLLASDNPSLNEEAAGLAAPYGDLIEFVSEELGGADVAELERLATALYFTKDEAIADPEKRAARIRQVKPHISESDAIDAVARVEEIFVKASQRPIAA